VPPLPADAIPDRRQDARGIARKVFLSILGADPVLFVFMAKCAAGLSEFVAANEEYAAHTPFCSNAPHDHGNLNTAYFCTEDPILGNHITTAVGLGIASLSLFLGVDIHLNFTEAVALGEAAPSPTSVTAELMHHDFRNLTRPWLLT
jgi:hypothetical protein